MSLDTGGPAFPAGSIRKSRPIQDSGGNFVVTDSTEPVNKGMTLRDYFAAKAMSMMSDFSAELGAIEAYKWADAMLKARNN